MSRVPGDAIHAAAVAMAQVDTGPDGTEPNDIDFLLAQIVLEAAAPHMHAVPKKKEDAGRYLMTIGEHGSVSFQSHEAALIECLFRGYKTLGFDTDCDTSGAEMLSRMGLGGGNLDAFIRLMDRSFEEARQDHDEATK